MSVSEPRELEWADGPGIVASIWRYKYSIAAFLVVIVPAVFLGSTQLPPVYSATATVVIAEVDAFSQDVGDPELRVQRAEDRIRSRRVFTAAAAALGDAVSAVELGEMVSVEADPVAGVVDVTAERNAPDDAADAANAVVTAYEEVNRAAAEARLTGAQEELDRQTQQLRRRVDELRSRIGNGSLDDSERRQLESLLSRIASLEGLSTDLSADAALFGSGIEDVETAVPPTEPSAPRPRRNAALAGIFGLGLASAAAYWRASYVDSLRFDPARAVDAPLLAEIPDFGLATEDARGNPLFDIIAMEAYQFLLTSFEFVLAGTNARSVLVTSASPGDGKSLTCVHLARALAIQGRDVTLVDADIRARGLTALLRAEDHDGLAALAAGESLEDCVRRFRVGEQVHLAVVPAGRPVGPLTGLLATARYRDAITRIIEGSELTIIDSGPLLTAADASAIASQVSGIVLIVDARISAEELSKVRDRLRLTATPLLGVVVNRVRDTGRGTYPNDSPDARRWHGPLRRWLGHRGRSTGPVVGDDPARSTA